MGALSNSAPYLHIGMIFVALLVMCTVAKSQEPAIPGFSVLITIPIPGKRFGRFRYRYRYQGWAKFDTDSDTNTKTLQML